MRGYRSRGTGNRVWGGARSSGQPSAVSCQLWSFGLLLSAFCLLPLAQAQPSKSAPTPPARQTLRWGKLEVSLPARVVPGQAFSVEFSGRGARHVRVRFPLEGFETLSSELEPNRARRSFVLGFAKLEDRNRVPLELISQYEVRTLTVPLERPTQAVQDLGFNKAEFLNINAHRTTEDRELAPIYARETPRAWSAPFEDAVKGRITSPFGTPRVYTPGTPISYHTGVDYGSPPSTPVYAANSGTVVFTGRRTVRGNLTVISHGLGLYTAYLHQSRILVRVGQKVARGQKIGEVGTTGLSTAPHLHLEFRLRGVPVQPLDWLGRFRP